MKTIKIEIDIRTNDVDGNIIPIKDTISIIMESLNNIWNIEGYNIYNKNGSLNKDCQEINNA